MWARRIGPLADGVVPLDTFAAIAELALWQDRPLDARAAIRETLTAFDGRLGRDQQFVTQLAKAVALGLRAEADLATRARSLGTEDDLAQSRSLGAALISRMRLAVEATTMSHPDHSREAAWLGTCEAEFSRLENTARPDLWSSAAAAWEARHTPYFRSYALMREAEATLAQHRDRARAGRVLAEGHRLAADLGAMPLQRSIELIATRAGIVLEPSASPVDHRASHPADDQAGLSDQPHVSSAVSRPPRRDDLTRRELEVLMLLAAGQSNAEIGDTLFISKKTASVHVASIKGKLGARSRVEIATDAIAFGLVDAPPTPNNMT